MSYSEFQASQDFIDKSHVNSETYNLLYKESINHPESFWTKQANRVHWSKAFTKATGGDFKNADIKWYEDGELNVCYNCVDRHLKDRADQTAILWQGDNPSESKNITYQELYHNVCIMANILQKHNVKKGDVVTIYMPMIPEAAYAMLACARIGAIHSVVFGGFSSESLKNRIINANSKFVITADESIRGG